MNPKTENKRFFSGIVKKAAGVAGVQFVNEPIKQSQVPQKEFATAPTVDSNAPVLGEVKTTQVDFGQPAAVASAPLESPLGQIPPVPDVPSGNTLNVVPPVPEIPKTPVPDTIQNAFQNDSQNAFNPTIVSPRENESATMAPSAVDAPPVIVPAEEVSAPEPQNTEVSNIAPVAPSVPPENPLVNNNLDVSDVPQEVQDATVSKEPVVVSPSMATPEIVPSDHVVTDSEGDELQSVPHVVENAFKDEPEDHLDPANEMSDVSASSNQETQSSEFNVKINPIAEDLLRKNSKEYFIKDANGKLIFKDEEFDAALFVKEVQERPDLKNLLAQLEKRGIGMNTIIDVFKELV